MLATGGETYYSRRLAGSAAAAAPVRRRDRARRRRLGAVAVGRPPRGRHGLLAFGALRSARWRGDSPRPLRPGSGIDDLKRIRGIGVLIEKKLNSLGVTHYEQVANWTGADIERISNILDFKGRIERENWIEQARILATGGQTEFSRRSEA